MENDDDDLEYKPYGRLWAAFSALLFLAFAFGGQGVAAVSIAVSGLLALPDLRDVWRRYGIAQKRRVYSACAAAGLALLIVVVAPRAGADATESDRETDTRPRDIESDDDAAADINVVDRAAAPLEVIVGCFAIDGDTLNCDGEIVRLLGIDAPEMPGSCATGRDCVPGDPFVSRAALIGALQYEMKVERVGYDVYGRSLALVYTERNNLSCSQLAASQAAYIEDWDDGGRVRAACPGIVLNAPSIHHR